MKIQSPLIITALSLVASLALANGGTAVISSQGIPTNTILKCPTTTNQSPARNASTGQPSPFAGNFNTGVMLNAGGELLCKYQSLFSNNTMYVGYLPALLNKNMKQKFAQAGGSWSNFSGFSSSSECSGPNCTFKLINNTQN